MPDPNRVYKERREAYRCGKKKKKRKKKVVSKVDFRVSLLLLSGSPVPKAQAEGVVGSDDMGRAIACSAQPIDALRRRQGPPGGVIPAELAGGWSSGSRGEKETWRLVFGR